MLICIIYILDTGLRHRTDLAPTALYGPELGIGAAQVLCIVHKVLQFLDYLQLPVKVRLFLLLKVLEIHCAASLVAGIQFLECTLDFDKWIDGYLLFLAAVCICT